VDALVTFVIVAAILAVAWEFARAYKSTRGNVSQRTDAAVKHLSIGLGRVVTRVVVVVAISYIVEWLAYLVGGAAITQPSWLVVLIVWVIYRMIENKLIDLRRPPRPADPFANATPDFRALMRALVASVELQNASLDDRKVSLIASILRRVYGKDFELTTVDTACRALSGLSGETGEELMGYLFDIASQLPPDSRRTIVRASATVLKQGPQLTSEQEEFLIHMSRSLGLPDEEVATNLASLSDIASATPHQ
jgi:hypothetical protein